MQVNLSKTARRSSDPALFMESSSSSKPAISLASQQRQQEQRRQAHFFKLTIPIALVLHFGVGLGLSGLIARSIADQPQEEVEIIADDTPKDNPPDLTQAVDPNGENGDMGGGGSSSFSLFQGNGGTADGNNIAALGNPFTTPETSSAETITPIEPSEKLSNPMPEVSPEVAQETKPEIPKKPEQKPQVKSETNSKIDPNVTKNTTPVATKLGKFDGKADGKGDKGDSNAGKLNTNAADGSGNGMGNGSGRGSGTGSGNGSGNGRPGRSGQPSKPNQTKPTSTKPNPIPSEAPKPIVPVAINPSVQSKPAKKKLKCIEDCSSEYLGAQGTLRISQEIGKDGRVIPKLLESSGDPELDRKALEAISRRRYESSEDGEQSTIRVTSQQQGSDFQRQQESRRQQRQAEQNTVDRERALQDQQNRNPIVPASVTPAAIEPTRPTPVAPIPIAPTPESVAPAPVAPTPEPVAPASVSTPAPEPVAPEPAPVAPAPEPVAPTSAPEPVAPEPVAPATAAPEPVTPPTP